MLVVDKPAGMVVHPAPGNWSGTLVNALKGRGGPLSELGRRGARGDRPPARQGDVGAAAGRQDRPRAPGAGRRDQAGARSSGGMPPCAGGTSTSDRITVDKPIARDPRDRKRMAIVSTGRAARTDFVRLARFDSVDLLRAHLHTGRTHQIRVHLSSLGHPVVGDDTYGGGGGRRLVPLPPKRHFLHAAWLRFRHPGHRGAGGAAVTAAGGSGEGARRGRGRRDVRSPTLDPLEHLWLLPRRLPESRATARTLLFRVAGKVYGCDIDAVREIIPYRRADAIAWRAAVRPGLDQPARDDRDGAGSGHAPRPGASAGAGRVDHPRHARHARGRRGGGRGDGRAGDLGGARRGSTAARATR